MPLLVTSAFIIVFSGLSEILAIFQDISFSSEAILSSSPDPDYEPKNSVRKPESTNRIPFYLIMHEPNTPDSEPKTPNHCLGPKVHRLSLELASI